MGSIRAEVATLSEDGMTPSEIARGLGVARPTVEYHLERLVLAEPVAVDVSPPPPAARTNVSTRGRVTELLSQGLSRAAIAQRLGVAKSTVSYHARAAGAPVDARCARRYDWTVIQRYYDQGHSLRECRAQFGFSSQTWHEAVKRGAVTPRPVKLATEEFFKAGVYRNRTYLKLRLLGEGHREPVCAACGLREWRGRQLSLALHHINGDRNDNRLVNLELLCPNCHSQTATFSGRNGHRRPKPTGHDSERFEGGRHVTVSR